MCRHAAYLGPPRALAELLIDPPRGLYEQSFAPRCQRHGRVNADGFGLGWWEGGEALRYRRAVPIWSDANLGDLAGRARSGAALGAVRDATTGSGLDEAAVAPYRTGALLFSHNGAVAHWRHLPEEIDTGLSPTDLLHVEALCDSALLWAMIGARVAEGRPLAAATASVVSLVAAVRPEARLNLLVMDEATIIAVRWGDSLTYRRSEAGVLVASEPLDDEPDWREVPQRHLIRATAAETAIRPLEQWEARWDASRSNRTWPRTTPGNNCAPMPSRD